MRLLHDLIVQCLECKNKPLQIIFIILLYELPFIIAILIHILKYFPIFN